MLLPRNASAQSSLSIAALSHARNLLDILCKTQELHVHALFSYTVQATALLAVVADLRAAEPKLDPLPPTFLFLCSLSPVPTVLSCLARN
jgi:hypothetical protein